MNEFPDNFNIKINKFRESKQKTLLRTIRKNFHDIIIKDSHNGLNYSILKFPQKLNREQRITICNELLVKFHKIEVTFDCKDSQLCGNYPLKKTFYGYPDDEFLSDYVSALNIKRININNVKISY